MCHVQAALTMEFGISIHVVCVVLIALGFTEASEFCGTFYCGHYCCYDHDWSDRYCCDDCTKSYHDSTRNAIACKGIGPLLPYQLGLIGLGAFILVGLTVTIIAYFACKNCYNTNPRKVAPAPANSGSGGTVTVVTTAEPPPPYATVVAQSAPKTSEPPPPAWQSTSDTSAATAPAW